MYPGHIEDIEASVVEKVVRLEPADFREGFIVEVEGDQLAAAAFTGHKLKLVLEFNGLTRGR